MASSAVASTSVARTTIERFLLRELADKPRHVRRYGPLPALEETKQAQSDKGADLRQLPNPFLPRFNQNTKRWADPKYSLRQQADLVKKAKAAGMLHHLPPGPKTPLLSPQEPRVQKYNPNYAAVAAAAFEAQAQQETKPRQKSCPVKTVETWTSYNSETDLDLPVHWEGKVDLKEKAGADVGIKLYAGKKRMFKGHRWERLKPQRERKQAILMRDMAKRVAAFKDYHKKKRPNPLKPARATAKSPKLPF